MEDDRKGIPLLYMFIGMMITATLIGGYFIIKIVTTEEVTDDTTETVELSLPENYTDLAWYGATEIGDTLENAIYLDSDFSYQFIVSENDDTRMFSYEEGYYIVLDLDTVALFPSTRSFFFEEGEALEYNGWILSLGDVIEADGETTVEMSGIYLNGGTEPITMYLYDDTATDLSGVEVTSTTDTAE